ncbi:hypothetical protein BST61_g4842 [Cercospora zeina]
MKCTASFKPYNGASLTIKNGDHAAPTNILPSQILPNGWSSLCSANVLQSTAHPSQPRAENGVRSVYKEQEIGIDQLSS